MLTLKGDFLCNILESIREEFTKNNLACVVLAPKEGGREGGREGRGNPPAEARVVRVSLPPLASGSSRRLASCTVTFCF